MAIKVKIISKVNQYFSIINQRTLYTVIISILVPYVCYNFEITYNIDLTLISIAIIFPLVFAIRGAFRRREKALGFCVSDRQVDRACRQEPRRRRQEDYVR